MKITCSLGCRRLLVVYEAQCALHGKSVLANWVELINVSDLFQLVIRKSGLIMMVVEAPRKIHYLDYMNSEPQGHVRGGERDLSCVHCFLGVDEEVAMSLVKGM